MKRAFGLALVLALLLLLPPTWSDAISDDQFGRAELLLGAGCILAVMLIGVDITWRGCQKLRP